MNITERDAVRLALIRALANGHQVPEAITIVARELCIAEEAVQDVVDELTEGAPA